ncbi:MAG: outer membrane beta-barrel protein [Vicinamibacterales bacterium]
MNRIGKGVAGLLLALLASGTAGAQSKLYKGSATGLVGATMGGSVADSVLTAGGSVSVQEDSGWGAEIDFGFANDDNARNLQADLTTAMVGVNWIKPRGPLRPLATFSAGVIGVRGCLLPCSRITSTWNFGIGAGGGVRYDLTDVVALGGEVRYFVAPGNHAGSSRPENFGFFRAAVGVTYSWAIVP